MWRMLYGLVFIRREMDVLRQSCQKTPSRFKLLNYLLLHLVFCLLVLTIGPKVYVKVESPHRTQDYHYTIIEDRKFHRMGNTETVLFKIESYCQNHISKTVLQRTYSLWRDILSRDPLYLYMGQMQVNYVILLNANYKKGVHKYYVKGFVT